MGGRGRLTTSQQRRELCSQVEQAVQSGARLSRSCEGLGLHPRTLRRWQADGTAGDRRAGAVRPPPANALTAQECAAILEVANAPEHADKPPAQIVPELADQGRYLASESTFYRVLRAHDQNHHRGRARAPHRQPKPVHTAGAPNQVWVWDITYLKTDIAGVYLYLYLILDLYSRKIVAHEVFPAENSEHSAALLRRAALAEGLAATGPRLVLHGDNGSPIKGGTVPAVLAQLGITPSRSRPRVSNDNAFAEAAIRTVKYHPSLNPDGFQDLPSARSWAEHLVTWYNTQHKHSALRFVTPTQKHAGSDSQVLDRRKALYNQAMAANPSRWIRKTTRNWTPILSTSLTPTDHRQIERIYKCAA